MDTKLVDRSLKGTKLSKPYSRGAYNKMNDTEQWIRLSEGCPNNCEYCNETKICGTEPIYFPIPKIERKKVKILDMNLLYKPRALEIIKELGKNKSKFELVCGIDYRHLTVDLAFALYENHFINIRLAWDHSIKLQKEVKNAITYLLSAGYYPNDIQVFILCNWRVSYEDNLSKLDLCKVWGVQVADCYFDNQLSLINGSSALVKTCTDGSICELDAGLSRGINLSSSEIGLLSLAKYSAD